MPKSQTSSPQATRNDTIVAHASCRVDLAGSTLDLWPLYLFHPAAVTSNFPVNILTRCQITPSADQAIHFKSIDTGREDHFRNFDEFCRAKATKHHLAEHLVRFFLPEGRNAQDARPNDASSLSRGRTHRSFGSDLRVRYRST